MCSVPFNQYRLLCIVVTPHVLDATHDLKGEHSKGCMAGGEVTLRHNSVRHLTHNHAHSGPMDVLRTAVSMLGLYDDRANIGEPDHAANREVAMSLCAQVGTIVAYFHRARQGLELRQSLDTAARQAVADGWAQLERVDRLGVVTPRRWQPVMSPVLHDGHLAET